MCLLPVKPFCFDEKTLSIVRYVLYKWKWNVSIVHEILYELMQFVSIVSEMLYNEKIVCIYCQ